MNVLREHARDSSLVHVPFFTFSTRLSTFQQCSRRGFWQFLYAGIGLAPNTLSIPLSTGSAVHLGVAYLLKRNALGIEEAVAAARSWYTSEVANNPAGFDEAEHGSELHKYYVAEQSALVEGLIRAFARELLPPIQAKYRVNAVEQEQPSVELPMPSSLRTHADLNSVFLLSRPDAVITDDEDSSFIVSLKTKGVQSEDSVPVEFTYDIQGLIETLMVELSMGRIIAGVIPIYLLKGSRRKTLIDEGIDGRQTYSPLIRGYRWSDPAGVIKRYAHSWNFPDPRNKSGKGSLGAGWKPFRVWETKGGVRVWLDMLARRAVQPELGDILAQQVVCCTPTFRRSDLMRHVIGQAIRREANNAILVAGLIKRAPTAKLALRITTEAEQEFLGIYSEQNLQECVDWTGRRCPYLDMCYDPSIQLAPLQSGKYRLRSPHHATEEAYFKRKG